MVDRMKSVDYDNVWKADIPTTFALANSSKLHPKYTYGNYTAAVGELARPVA